MQRTVETLVNEAAKARKSRSGPTYRALMGWAVVVVLALMSYFVHVLHVHIEQADAMHERWRYAQPTPARAALGPAAPSRLLRGAR